MSDNMREDQPPAGVPVPIEEDERDEGGDETGGDETGGDDAGADGTGADDTGADDTGADDARGAAAHAPTGRRRLWPWWHRQSVRTRRVIRGSLALTATLAVAALAAVFTTSVQSSLGPHEAEYRITADSEITIDLGPLGAILIDSPLPGPVGVAVAVGEIPAELTALTANPITGLVRDLDAYVQLFSQPEAAIADARTALVNDVLGRTVMYWSIMLVAIAAARYASRGLLRREVATALRRPGVAVLIGGVVVATGAATLASLGEESREGVPISALDGTELEGLRMTGRMAELIDVYGGQLVDAYRENEEFYAAAAANLQQAYDGDVTAPGAVPDVAGAEAEVVTLLVVSDLHCNVGMAPVVAAVAELAGAQVVLDAGDTVMSGTSVESYCVNAFSGALSDDVDLVVATGNHDSVTTAEQMRSAGYIVLEGEPIDLRGVSILGDTDPTLTAWGEGTQLEREETFEELGERLAERACEAGGVDLLLVHNPRAAVATVESGCAAMTISGHIHRRDGPELVGQTVRYTSSSTAGAVSGGATVGPLNGIAELTVIRIDVAAGELLEYRIIEIGTDASVSLGLWTDLPRPVPEPDPSVDDVPGAGQDDEDETGSVEQDGEGEGSTDEVQDEDGSVEDGSTPEELDEPTGQDAGTG